MIYCSELATTETNVCWDIGDQATDQSFICSYHSQYIDTYILYVHIIHKRAFMTAFMTTYMTAYMTAYHRPVIYMLTSYTREQTMARIEYSKILEKEKSLML